LLADWIIIPSSCLTFACWLDYNTLIMFNIYLLVWLQYLVMFSIYLLVWLQYPHHVQHLFDVLITNPSWFINEYSIFFINIHIHLIRCFCRSWGAFAWKWSWKKTTKSYNGRCRLGTQGVNCQGGSARSMDALKITQLNGCFSNIWTTNMGFTWR
jgi:hypothetical protein